MQLTKDILKKNRSKICGNKWPHDQITEFEKTYGKYLYVPLDIPKIVINDIEKFKSFHEKYGVIGQTLNKIPQEAEMWGQNNYNQIIFNSNSIYSKFLNKIAPELKEQFLEYLPFICPDFDDWCIWSTRKDIPRHRDQRPMVDAPVLIRIMLYDDNPVQTLKLHLDPIDRTVDYSFHIDLPEETNTFTWNNLRVSHDSVYFPNHSKLLWIFSQRIDPYFLHDDRLNRYIDLLDKSIAKYQKQTRIDTLTTTDNYIEI
jgi:hypothetical protein